jgi:phosphatidylglycerol:prolipoprotein diacylglycerol transferase
MENWIAAWRNIPAHLSPYLFEIGSFQLRWYSLMYLAAFGCIYLLVMRQIRRENFPYVFFYNLAYYLKHPLEILFPFEFNGGLHFIGISGMSYHGGAIAVLIATLIFCRKRGIDFWRFADLFSSVIPLGYTFGRIGNFINGELYGRATDVPWGMLFPLDPKHLLRHPSQLYEAFFEGIVLFAVLWVVRKKVSTTGALFAFYIMGYGVVRFFIEFFREPDVQLGFVLGPFSMGQLLCLLMILAGAAIYALRRKSMTSPIR